MGTLTQRFMRIEKFIPFWGEEITSFVTPYETGYGHTVKLNVSISQFEIILKHHLFNINKEKHDEIIINFVKYKFEKSILNGKNHAYVTF